MKRKAILATGEYYHVFNKTVNNQLCFNKKKFLDRALQLCNYYRFPTDLSYSKFNELNAQAKTTKWFLLSSKEPLVKIHAFDFMPNHFHFLLQQTQDQGIKRFITNLENGFAKYFNTVSDREGSLFKEGFKRVWIENEEQCLHVSRYIHLNHVTSYLMNIEEIVDYPYNSFSTYMKKYLNEFVTTEMIESYFKNSQSHNKFVFNQADYQRSLKDLNHLFLEK